MEVIPPGRPQSALRATDIERVVMTTTLDKVLNWAASNSLWPFGFGLACCAMEMIAMVTPRYDIGRFGSEIVRATPRQSDLLIVSGRVSHRMTAPIRELYEQMLEPKWVMAMGACSSTGGMFANYAILQGVDKIVPVDVYVPGLPAAARGRDRGRHDDPEARSRPASRPPTSSSGRRHERARRCRRAGRGPRRTRP